MLQYADMKDGTTQISGFRSDQDVIILVDSEDVDKIRAMEPWFYHKGRQYVVAFKGNYGGKTTIMLHRYVMNADKGSIVDHINGDILDCRKANLRFTTSSGNLGNQHSRDRVGVSKVRDVWTAHIACDGKQHYLGTFDTEEDACRAYNIASRELRGEVCTLNDVEDPFREPVRRQRSVPSKFKGVYTRKEPKYYVYKHGKRWAVKRYFQKKYTSLGYYDTEAQGWDAVESAKKCEIIEKSCV